MEQVKSNGDGYIKHFIGQIVRIRTQTLKYFYPIPFKINSDSKYSHLYLRIFKPDQQQQQQTRSDQSILKEINPECSLEGPMLKLKLQHYGHLIKESTSWKRPWCWARLRQKEKEVTEDEMAGWHHWLSGHESE